MMNKKAQSKNQQQTAEMPVVSGKKVYLAPQWIDRGDVRDVTLGGSPGVGESGQATIFMP